MCKNRTDLVLSGNLAIFRPRDSGSPRSLTYPHTGPLFGPAPSCDWGRWEGGLPGDKMPFSKRKLGTQRIFIVRSGHKWTTGRGKKLALKCKLRSPLNHWWSVSPECPWWGDCSWVLQHYCPVRKCLLPFGTASSLPHHVHVVWQPWWTTCLGIVELSRKNLEPYAILTRQPTRDLAPKANVLCCCHHRHTPHRGGVVYPWGGVDFGPYLVEGWQGGGIYGGGSAKPKVLLLAKPLELQYYFAPFSKAAK